MHRIPAGQLIVLLIQTGIVIALLIRLLVAGLYRIYPFFFSYIALMLVQSALLGAVPYDSFFYRYVWAATSILFAGLQALVVLELYSVVLRDLGGFAGLARRYTRATLGVAVVVSLILLALEKTPAGFVELALVVDRVIVLALVVLVLFILTFLVYYPISLNRNTIVYSAGFVTYFLTKSAARLIQNASHQWYSQISTVLVVVSTACVLLWALALSREGEKKTMVIGHRWNREDEERLLSQLKEINASLLRTARK